ncbi:MAG TPA: helix-turn-helix domain-containing protein [Candidatus Bathyarchaeia archaeon]
MTQEWMIKTLMSLGFGQLDAEVYAFLALNGAQKASTIAEAIRIYIRQVYRALEKLEKREIVSGTENPRAHFVALPFDKLLDLLVKKNLLEARQIEQNKDNLVALWSSWAEKEQAR